MGIIQFGFGNDRLGINPQGLSFGKCSGDSLMFKQGDGKVSHQGSPVR
jgi:hypothetical protein